jgi:adenine-specific DNA-methyltransferase
MTNTILRGNSAVDLRGALYDFSHAQPINCIVTDPPYGVNYRSRHAETPDGLRWVKDVKNDLNLTGALGLFQDVMDEILPMTEDQAEMYVFTRWDIVGDWIEAIRSLSRHGWKYKMLLVWDKMEPGTGDIDNNWGCGHELILYAKKGLRRAPYRRSGVLHFRKVPPAHIIHPTEKPVPLLEELIKFSTNPGDLVVDPFSGSGSTSIACVNTGRDSFAMEEDKEHYDHSMRRLDGAATLF